MYNDNNAKEIINSLGSGKVIKYKNSDRYIYSVNEDINQRGVPLVKIATSVKDMLNYDKHETHICTLDFIVHQILSGERFEIYRPIYDYCGNKYKASIISEKNRLLRDYKKGNISFLQVKSYLSKYITDIIYRQMEHESDNDILKFIENFSLSFGVERYNDTIYPLFASGYCYYFAKMLQEAFSEKQGQLCLCYPYGHIVYMVDNVVYDISGCNNNDEAELFIPIDRYLIEEDIINFKHIPGKHYVLNNEYTFEVEEKFCAEFLKTIGLGDIFEDIDNV